MPAQELELIAHERLVLGAVVDVEVIHPWVDAQLSQRRSPRGGDRDRGLGDTIGVPHAHEPRAVQFPRVAHGPEGARKIQRAEARLRQRDSSPIATT